MSVEEIASRLDDRFALLNSGSRAALPRHQTLRATIDWSYDLLTGNEKLLFRRMAVFAGGFSLAGAEAVCSFAGLKRSEILNLVGRLVDKSLVFVVQTSVSTTRYRMLETIHEYAREKLDESGEVIDLGNHHLEYFVRLAEQAEQNTFGAESVKYHMHMDEQWDDIRLAMEWAIQSLQAPMAFRLSAALYYFWYNRSLIGNEWQQQLEEALPLLETLHSERQADPEALFLLGLCYLDRDRPGKARRVLKELIRSGPARWKYQQALGLAEGWSAIPAVNDMAEIKKGCPRGTAKFKSKEMI